MVLTWKQTLPENAHGNDIEWQPRYWMKERPAREATYLMKGDGGIWRVMEGGGGWWKVVEGGGGW